MIGYNDDDDLTAYAAARGVQLVTDPDVLLTKALDWLELQPFSGEKTDPEQALEFPRNGDTEVPTKIKTAQLVAAMIYADGGDPLAAITPKVTEETVFGAVSVKYADGGSSVTLYPQLSALLAPYLKNGGGSSQFQVSRA